MADEKDPLTMAQEAHRKAEKAREALRSHENECGVRYGELHRTLSEVKQGQRDLHERFNSLLGRFLAWGGSIIFVLMIALGTVVWYQILQ